MNHDLALWTYTQPTSGIFYFNATAGAAGLPEPLLIWAPFFSYVFSRIGTVKDDYSQMARRIDAATGGFGMAASARMHYDHSLECQPILALNAKCLPRNLESMISIVEDLIEGADFNDHDRLKQLLGEYVSGLESMIVQNGHRLAISLSARTSSPASAISEAWSGIHQIRTVREFNRDLDQQKLKLLSATLADIAAAVFLPKNLAMAVVGEPQPIDQAKQLFSRSKTLARFERMAETPALPRKDYTLEKELPYEGWSVSSAVAFVAQTSKTVPIVHSDAPALAVLSKALRSLYLHREIREKGGAYGGFALYNPEIGLFSLASYRDPHVVRTMDVFSGIGEFIGTDALSDEDVKEAILQVCSEIDKPDPPGPAARKAFARMIIGLTDDIRRTFKDNLLKVTKDRLIDVAEHYAIGKRDASGVAVIAGQPLLETANEELTSKPLRLRTI
jgi:Zn-dependent M16 (insulinase) family peptidase